VGFQLKVNPSRIETTISGRNVLGADGSIKINPSRLETSL